MSTRTYVQGGCLLMTTIYINTETQRHKGHSLPGVRHSPLLRRQLQLPASMHSGPVPGAESGAG